MDPLEPELTVSLRDLVDRETFGEVLDSFSRLFQIPIRLFDGDGSLLLEVATYNPVCEYLLTLEKSRARCTTVRSRLKAAPPPAPGSRTDVDCFCGLRYTISGVPVDNDVAAKIVVGPYLPAALERVPGAVAEVEPRVDQARLRDAMGSLRRLGDKNAQAAADAIVSVVSALLFSTRKAHVTNQMHMATVRESYRELMDKNRRLEEIAEERKEFDRRKSNFLAMVSHELRTPLTSIIGYSDMLTEGIAGDLAAEQMQFVRTIKTKGDELLKLISSILDFSQIDTGRLTMKLSAVDPRIVIERAVAANKDVAARRGIRLSVTLPQNLPAATMDAEKIQTALSHLIDNGIKFSTPGGIVKVTARVAASAEGDGEEDGIGFVLLAAPDMLEISIEDYGVGIDEIGQSRIFAPFTQIDESSTREHGGAGLGLAIVKHYVEAHGGRVHVRSHPDEGSNFTVRIPLILD